MAVYKDAKRNTWYVSFRYSDSFGNRKRKLKRGFRTKTEANRWEMDFWTQEEYKKFIETMMDQPYYFYGFEILYWCGLRIGELLALTPADFDFEKKTVSINKSYQRINKKDVITEPKTSKSIRTIIMPDFLSDEIEDFIEMHYGIQPNQRIFPLTKRHYELQIKNGSKTAGVKTIRVHDLRHSHVSLSQGYFWDSLADCLR